MAGTNKLPPPTGMFVGCHLILSWCPSPILSPSSYFLLLHHLFVSSWVLVWPRLMLNLWYTQIWPWTSDPLLSISQVLWFWRQWESLLGSISSLNHTPSFLEKFLSFWYTQHHINGILYIFVLGWTIYSSSPDALCKNCLQFMTWLSVCSMKTGNQFF